MSWAAMEIGARNPPIRLNKRPAKAIGEAAMMQQGCSDAHNGMEMSDSVVMMRLQ